MDIQAKSQIISTYDLSIGYKKGNSIKILGNQINIDAHQGELIALVGSNGSGKSTLIRTLSLIHPALNGEIEISGKKASHFSRIEAALNISIVTTELIRTNDLNVFSLVSLGRFPHGNWFVPVPDADKKIIQKSISDVGMQEYNYRLVSELSDGEYQRVMIARALAQDTPIVLLDEPTAFLDLENKFSIASLLWKLTRKNKKTIIFSTHDLNIATQFADKFWVLNQHSVKEGAPEDLLLDGTIEQLFGQGNIFFDSDSNQYRIKKEFKKFLALKGEGRAYILTKLALQRLGFETNCNNPECATVLIVQIGNKTCWQINYQNKEQVCSSIYELQQVLRNI